jgi:hypothetical protein
MVAITFNFAFDDSVGTLVYGNYGHLQDFQQLRKSLPSLNGSIALIRFGSLHPSNVVSKVDFNFFLTTHSCAL